VSNNIALKIPSVEQIIVMKVLVKTAKLCLAVETICASIQVFVKSLNALWKLHLQIVRPKNNATLMVKLLLSARK
jgi:hypothetical protein